MILGLGSEFAPQILSGFGLDYSLILPLSSCDSEQLRRNCATQVQVISTQTMQQDEIVSQFRHKDPQG